MSLSGQEKSCKRLWSRWRPTEEPLSFGPVLIRQGCDFEEIDFSLGEKVIFNDLPVLHARLDIFNIRHVNIHPNIV